MPYQFSEGRPWSNVDAVTPSDSVDLPHESHGLYIGVTGNLTVIMAGDMTSTPRLFANHPQGYAPLRVRRVMLTGTTAGSILSGYG